MMFLEFFIWGGWYVTMGTYLTQTFSASGVDLALAQETRSLGALIAPFILGLIADRYFAAQKLQGVLHFLGGVIAYCSCQSKFFFVILPLCIVVHDIIHANACAGQCNSI